MKARNVYDLLFKAIGIFIFIYSLESLKNLFIYLFIPYSFEKPFQLDNYSDLLLNLLYFLIVFTISYFFVFKTDRILNKLPQNTLRNEENIDFSGNIQNSFRVILISLGIYLMVTEFPIFISGIIRQVMVVQNNADDFGFDRYYLWIALIRLVFAFFLIFGSRAISSYFFKEKNGTDPNKKEVA